MKSVIVMTEYFLGDTTISVFSSTKTLLKYYEQLYPNAKSLRIKERTWFLQVLNHNSPISNWTTTIKRVKVDEELK